MNFKCFFSCVAVASAAAALAFPPSSGVTAKAMRFDENFTQRPSAHTFFKTVWCGGGTYRSRAGKLASTNESFATMLDEWYAEEARREDGTYFISLDKVRPKPSSEFTLNIGARSSFNPQPFYFAQFRHDWDAYRKFRADYPGFLGFECWEWGNDAYLPLRRPDRLVNCRHNPLSSNELAQVVQRTPKPPSREAFVNDLLKPTFDRVVEWNFGNAKDTIFGEGHYCIGHLAAYWGAGEIGIETTRDYLFWQIQMMFCRGAARQFSVPWKWYLASFLGGLSDGKWCDGTFFAEDDPRHPRCGPSFGVSQSAMKRATYLTYLSGANYYEREAMTKTHFLVRDGKPRLSCEGEMFDAFHAFTKRVDRGTPYVPIALLVPAARGYTRLAGKAFGLYGYTRADHMLDAVMSTILDFPSNRLATNEARRIERVMANSRYGDVFDVLTPDFPDSSAFARTLGDYRAAVLIGDYGENKALTETLRTFVNEGGMLVLSSAQLATFPLDLTTAKPLGNRAFSVVKIGKGRAIVGQTPYLVPWSGDDAAGQAKALKDIALGEPVRHPDLDWLFDNLERQLLPIRVTGFVQYGINRTADGWLVYLIDNSGVVKQADRPQEIEPGGTEVTLDLSRISHGSIREAVAGEQVTCVDDVVRLTVPHGDVRVISIKRQQDDSAVIGEDDVRLRFGVLSDIHIATTNSQVVFEKALRKFDEWKADGVLVSGDLADHGLVQQLQLVADSWFRVFPDGKGADGRPVANLMHFGDHDTCRFFWKQKVPSEVWSEEERRAGVIMNGDRAAIWEKCFHEKWAPIQLKTVKGYDFVLCHFTHGEADNPDGDNTPGLAEFFAAHAFSRTRPMFLSQHRPPRGTILGPFEIPTDNQDDGRSGRIFSDYPNLTVFFGHLHDSVANEKNIWQGRYNVIHAPSLSYAATRGGRENGYNGGDRERYSPKNPPKLMPQHPSGATHQGLFCTVSDREIVVRRYDFEYDLPMGPDWVLPISSFALDPSEKPFAPAVRERELAVPEFAPDARVLIAEIVAQDRAGRKREMIDVSFPPALVNARANDYEVMAEIGQDDVWRVLAQKRVYSPRYQYPPEMETEPVHCWFSRDEIPTGWPVRYTVRPCNAFGVKGRPSSLFR